MSCVRLKVHCLLPFFWSIISICFLTTRYPKIRYDNRFQDLHSKRGNKQAVDFPLSFVNCELKPLGLLVVHIIIDVSVIHIDFGCTLFAH
jgi:hypothetical protein